MKTKLILIFILLGNTYLHSQCIDCPEDKGISTNAANAVNCEELLNRLELLINK